jgi:hypothetical protein
MPNLPDALQRSTGRFHLIHAPRVDFRMKGGPMNKMTSCIASIAITLAATAAVAQQAGMKVDVLIVESVEDFQRWLQQEPAPQGPYPPRLKEVPASKKIHFPILVRGLRPPDQGVLTLVADVEFFGPDGKSLFAAPKCCRFKITNRPDIRTAMLGGTPYFELDPGNPQGPYTVRVSVTDGSQQAATSETFLFAAGGSAVPEPAPATTAAPRLRMGTPPAKNPGRDVDKRDCLALPTPAEIIKCTGEK